MGLTEGSCPAGLTGYKQSAALILPDPATGFCESRRRTPGLLQAAPRKQPVHTPDLSWAPRPFAGVRPPGGLPSRAPQPWPAPPAKPLGSPFALQPQSGAVRVVERRAAAPSRCTRPPSCSAEPVGANPAAVAYPPQCLCPCLSPTSSRPLNTGSLLPC